MTVPLTYTVFTDFDGTIALKDIGDHMFAEFGEMQVCFDSFESYRRGEITARQCWQRGFETLRPVTREQFTAFAGAQSIDPHFRPFVDYCSSKKIPVTILSDGFDAYIDPVLTKERLEWLPRFTNIMTFHSDGTVTPEFPHTDAECTRCANCKRIHLLTGSGDDQVIVYIGDGISDRCPVRYADVVFAKDALVGFCETENITYHRFTSFADVLQKFTSLVETTKPKKRRTAELARKDIFMTE